MAFTLEMARHALDKLNETIEEKKDYLTELDSAIGDADHGTNMNRGIRRAVEKIRDKSCDTFADLFKEVAMTVMSAVGGSAGPLYGTFFMKLGQKLGAQREVNVLEFAEAMQEGLAGVMSLGKSHPGDKTMIDALAPAIDALRQGAESGDVEAWKKAAEASEEGMKATIPMLAKRGRSSYLSERSIGHQDPGATSSYYMVASFRDAVVEG